MEYVMSEVIRAIECYNTKDEIGCAIHLQNGGNIAKTMFVNYLKYKDFNYTRKSKKYRILKKNAKQKGFNYIKRMYLPTKVLILESTKDIKSQIDKMGE